MIDYRAIETVIVTGLEAFLDNTPVIMANQTSPVPKYPYVSYTIITPVLSRGGTHGRHENNRLYKQLNQTWSFTVHSNDQTKSVEIALSLLDYFAHLGTTYLSDNNIAVVNVSNVTNRDNLVTVEYEYRQGLDVTFGLMDEIKDLAGESDIIETADIKSNF